MKLWPTSLAGRIAAALLGAAAVVVALDVTVAAWDRARRPLAHRADAGDAPAAEPVEPDPAAVLGFRLRATAGSIVLAQRLASLSPDVAPVVEILPDGGLVLRRPAPLASTPGALPPLSRAGHGAGVVLPAARAELLTPQQRGALVRLLGRWIEQRPAPAARLVAADFELPASAAAALLAWLP